MDTDSTQRSAVRQYLEIALVAFIFLNYTRVFLVQAFRIPSESMRETLVVGDHILVNKFILGTSPWPPFPSRELSRGDVVVFRSPEQPHIKFVKRIVGVPGDVILLRDKRLAVNGRLIEENYAVREDPVTFPRMDQLPEPQRSRDQFGPLTIPPESFFVMGDNRDHSYDSRFWGVVPRSLISGRAFVIYWSFDGIVQSARTEDRFRELVTVVTHFFDWTRWDRTLKPIADYHCSIENSNRRTT